jgi:hypothetical protein
LFGFWGFKFGFSGFFILISGIRRFYQIVIIKKKNPEEENPVYLAHSRDMRIIPGVVVDEDCAIGHGGDLIAVIPPGHDFCVL